LSEDEYLLCVLKELEQEQTLRDLYVTLSRTPSASIPAVVLGLHELGHGALATGHPAVSRWREISKSVFESHREAAIKWVTGEVDLRELKISGTTWDQMDGDALASQLKMYGQALYADPEVVEELTCDCVAALAFLCFGKNANFLNDEFPGKVDMTLQDFGDALIRVYFSLKSMQIVQSVELTCQNMGGNQDSWFLSEAFLHVVIRSSVLGNIFTRLFDLVPGQVEFLASENGDILDKNSFLASLAQLDARYERAIYGPLNDMIVFFGDKEKTAASLQEAMEVLGLGFEQEMDRSTLADQIRVRL
jgi:hypothetical protein